MNRTEFMQRLQRAIAGMPEEERRRAVEYYENYFDEAGPENEAEVLHTLGAPEKVAADILREFRDVSGPGAQDGGARGESGAKSYAGRAKARFCEMDGGQKVLVLALAAVAAVCVVPVCVGLIGGVGGLLFGLLAAVAAVFCIAPILSITAWVCAALFVFAAVTTATVGTAAELLLLVGLTLVSAGLGILFWKLTVYLFRKLFPALLNGIAGLFRGLFHRS